MDVSNTAVAGLPAGVMLDYAGSSAPTGYMLCDGSTISRTTYARLFDAIGITWGAGDGSTTFKLPDYRGRVAVGAGTGSGLTARTLGASSGFETHTLTSAEMPSHTHTQDSHNHTQDAHSHVVSGRDNSASSSTTMPMMDQFTVADVSVNTSSVTATNQATTATNQNTGGGGSHNNMQPYAVANKIIKF